MMKRDLLLVGLILAGTMLACLALLDVAQYRNFLWLLIRR